MSAIATRRYLVVGALPRLSRPKDLDMFIDRLNKGPIDYKNADVIMAPPRHNLSFLRQKLPRKIQISAQNISDCNKTNQEDDASINTIKTDGEWIILNSAQYSRSEEPDVLSQKIVLSMSKGLGIILCIQFIPCIILNTPKPDASSVALKNILANVTDWKRLVIAYENTIGKMELKIVETVSKSIRRFLKRNISATSANSCRIIFGDNHLTNDGCFQALGIKDLDGFYVSECVKNEDLIRIININN